MKVQEVIDLILNNTIGDFRLEQTCDLIMTGSADTEVKGIATTFMATVDVIRQAVKAGVNMIITHEPTWFTGMDQTGWLKDDPVFHTKKKLIEDNDIAIWRFHDHMHMAKPDMIYVGLQKELSWENFMIKDQEMPHYYEIPETTLAVLADFFKRKFAMSSIRILGNPEMKCGRVGILVGGGSLGLGREEMPMEEMKKMDLDVIVCGEITEWTLPAYVNDAQMLGFNKALIIIGHERTEEWGMKYLAGWLLPLVNGIPVAFIDAKEPFRYM